jgi:hypothetical protein
VAKKPTPVKKTKSKTPSRHTPKAAKAGQRTPAKSAPKVAAVPVTATIRSVDALSKLPALAKQLASEGMIVNQVLERSGMISGSCPPDRIAALNDKVPEVVVEPDLIAHPS